jgi:hypothetical protein
MKRTYVLSLFCLLVCAGMPVARGAEIFMDGHIDFAVSGSRMHIFIEDITNFSDTRTDRLRIRMWASEDRWHPDRKGRLLTFTRIARLGPFGDFDDVNLSRPWHRPPPDLYYVTITLEERTFNEEGVAEWVIRDAVEFNDRFYFSDWDWPFPF